MIVEGANMLYDEHWYTEVDRIERVIRGYDPGPWTDAQEQYLERAYEEGLTPQQAAEGLAGLTGEE